MGDVAAEHALRSDGRRGRAGLFVAAQRDRPGARAALAYDEGGHQRAARSRGVAATARSRWRFDLLGAAAGGHVPAPHVDCGGVRAILTYAIASRGSAEVTWWLPAGGPPGRCGWRTCAAGAEACRAARAHRWVGRWAATPPEAERSWRPRGRRRRSVRRRRRVRRSSTWSALREPVSRRAGPGRNTRMPRTKCDSSWLREVMRERSTARAEEVVTTVAAGVPPRGRHRAPPVRACDDAPHTREGGRRRAGGGARVKRGCGIVVWGSGEAARGRWPTTIPLDLPSRAGRALSGAKI